MIISLKVTPVRVFWLYISLSLKYWISISKKTQVVNCKNLEFLLKIYLWCLIIDFHPGGIRHVLVVFIAFVMISYFSFQGHLSLGFINSCFCPSLDCILLNLLDGAHISQTCILTSCAPLSNTVIALNMTAILLRFPFNRIPSNEIWTSTISPMRMAFGLISWCLNDNRQVYSVMLVVTWLT